MDTQYNTKAAHMEDFIIAKEIAEESECGKGSMTFFTFPNPAKAQKVIVVEKFVYEEGPDNQIKAEVSELKILIAEDDEISEILLTIIVKMVAKQILYARSGIETIETCRLNPNIDLILMDILFPDLNGYEVTSRIRQFNKEVVIIAQTALGLLGEKEKAIAAGCNDYISKPIIKETLLELIQKNFKK